MPCAGGSGGLARLPRLLPKPPAPPPGPRECEVEREPAARVRCSSAPEKALPPPPPPQGRLLASLLGEREAACDARGCDPSSVDADARMRGLTTATNVAIGVGGAAVAGAAVWFLVSRLGGRETERARPTAWVFPTATGIAVGGVL